MRQRLRRISGTVLIGVGLIALALAWALSLQSPVVIARFAFQSPGVTDTPASSGAEPAPFPEGGEVTSPTPGAQPLNQEQAPEAAPVEGNPGGREPSLPGASRLVAVTPQEDQLSVLRSLAIAFGYVWLGCGVLLLIAIPFALAWLNWRGRRPKP